MPSTKLHKKVVLETHGLAIGYGKAQHEKVLASNLNLQLQAGHLVSLIGPNGAGKSTLIRTLCQLQEPLDGMVKLFTGKDNSFAHQIAVVLTSPVYAPNFTVYDMVSAGRYPYTNWLGKLSKIDQEIVQQSIDSVGINDLATRMIYQLSDGEKQRMMIAKALAQQSPIIILDEPTAHLDLINRVEITKLLRKLASTEGKAILMATHELDMAMQTSDRLWIMDSSAMVCGAPEDLVLKGELQRVFSKLSLDFDRNAGVFKIKSDFDKTISFQNTYQTDYELWTIRALHKLGFAQSDDSQLQLTWDLQSKKWLLASANFSQDFESLGSLCDYLVEYR